MKHLHVGDRVMISHDACISGTSRVLTVASLQRLKLEALTPALADFEVRSVIKCLDAQRIASIEIHRWLCHIWLNGQHFSYRSLAVRCLIIIHAIVRISRPVIFIFSRNSCLMSVGVFRMRERGRDDCHTVVSIPGVRFLWHWI